MFNTYAKAITINHNQNGGFHFTYKSSLHLTYILSII